MGMAALYERGSLKSPLRSLCSGFIFYIQNADGFNFLFDFRAMPLNNLVCFLFLNEDGDYKYLNLIDEKWKSNVTIEQKMKLELHTKVDISIDGSPKTYFLIMKGPEKDVYPEYQKLVGEPSSLKQSGSKDTIELDENLRADQNSPVESNVIDQVSNEKSTTRKRRNVFREFKDKTSEISKKSSKTSVSIK